MVVALSAVQAYAQEHPHVLSHLFVGPHDLSADRLDEMPGGPAVALGRHPFPGHLVVGFVPGQALADPALVAVGIAIDHPEEVGEAEGPVVDILGRVQQPLDQTLPLPRIPVCQEFTHAAGGRQGPRQVQAHPPQESGVA